MSIKTTHMVTRDFAIQAILSRLYTMGDEQLSYVLEEAIHNGFYNFRIATPEEMRENVETTGYQMPTLTDLSNLPEYNNAH